MVSASGFVLSLLSPVWRAKLGGAFGNARQLDLEAVDAPLFSSVLALGCGAAVSLVGGMEALLALGLMADKYQVSLHIRHTNPPNLSPLHQSVQRRRCIPSKANTVPSPRGRWRR